MEIQIALIISVIAQFIAFFITISLIPKTRFNIAWISISLGFLLMAFRRLMEVLLFFKATTTDNITNINSWIAVVISFTMLLSSIYIRKIFEVFNRIHKFRKENEARLLSTIISTEEHERKHFAKELHDGLGPLLSSAKMTISAFDKTQISERNGQLLNKVEEMVDNAIVSTKEISNHLTPHILERYGLKKAIDTFIRNIVTNENIKIDFSCNIEKQRYKNNAEVIIYRICCELINNTLKHASSNKINISLTDDSINLKLKYEDNGVGFDISEIENKGMGLTNIKSRVKSLNGLFDIKTAPKKGFFVSIKLPCT